MRSRRRRSDRSGSALRLIILIAGAAAILSPAALCPAAQNGAPETRTSPQNAGQTAPQSSAAEGEEYVLQVGDEISIKVFNNADMHETLRIRPDGKISVQLMDDVKAAGKTTRELKDALTPQYAKFLRDPQVAVIVRTFSNQKIYVGGEVTQPGVLPLVGTMTVASAVLQAGGLKDTAKPESVILIRNSGSDQPLVVRVDVKQILERGKPDILLQPFDVVYVPMSKIARIDKFIHQYIRQLIPITATGGFTYILGQREILVTP